MKHLTDIINKLNKTIKKSYKDFNGIYLYGSYAAQKNTPNSDIDIVALFDKAPNREQRLNMWNIIGKLELDFGVTFDFHPMTKEELKQNPIYYNQVVNKGIFYGAR